MTGRIADRLTPEALTDRVRKLHRLEQLQVQGFFGGWLREAWFTRFVVRYGELFRESFVLHTSPTDDVGVPDSDASLDVVVLGRSRFSVPAADGPILISDRTFGDALPDPVKWVDMTLQSAGTLGVESEAPPREELPEDLFWELISLLEGSLSEGSVERLVAAMRDWDYARQIAYQETLDRKLFELDSPGNTVAYASDPAIVDGEASLMYRCEILSKGREAFASHIARPRPGTPGLDGVRLISWCHFPPALRRR